MSVLGEVKGKVLRSLPFGGDSDAPKLDREQVLNARPVRNPDVEWELDGAHVILEIPRDYHWYVRMMSYLFNIPKTHKVRLDHIGSEVWQSLDGEQTVEEIAERMAKEHRLGYKEMELSLLEFLKDLAKRQFIGVLIKNETAAAAEGDQDGAAEANEDASDEDPPAGQQAPADAAANGHSDDGAASDAGAGEGGSADEADVSAITRAIMSRPDVTDLKEEK